MAQRIQAVRLHVDASWGGAGIDAVQFLTGDAPAAMTLSAWSFGAGGLAVYTGYNEAGQAVGVESYLRGHLARQEEFSYHESGQVAAYTATNAAGQATHETYDEAGHVLTRTLAYGTFGAATTTYAWDGDNLLSLIDPLENETTWGYSPEGREILMTDPNLKEVVKTYDEKGRLASILNRNNLLRTFEYDEWNNLQYEKWYDGPTTGATLVKTFTWTFNAQGLLLSASVADGTDTFTYTYTYNSTRQLVRVELPFGVVLTFGYDQYGNRNLVRDSLGGEERSIYDAYGLLQTRTLKQGTEELRLDFTYTRRGQVETITRYSDLAGTSLIATTYYAYDEWDNIASIVTLDDEEEPINAFEYDWDLAGQLLAKTEYQPALNALPQEFTYTYDNQGQLTGDGTNTWDWDLNGNPDGTTIDPGNQLRENEEWTFTYDGEGNMTGKEEMDGDLKWSYYFSHANQLVKVERRTNGTDVDLEVDFKYDPYGNRVEKAVDPDGIGVETAQVMRFALDGWNNTKASPIGNENWDVFADLDGSSSLATRYLRGDVVDQLFARVGSGDPFWLLSDNLGSIRDVLGETGALAKSVAYLAFGGIQDQVGTGELGRYGWTGREIDAEIELQYNRARYYDWEMGRWISQDPLGFDAGDSNIYRYIKNNFLTYLDPSGLEIWQSHPDEKKDYPNIGVFMDETLYNISINIAKKGMDAMKKRIMEEPTENQLLSYEGAKRLYDLTKRGDIKVNTYYIDGRDHDVQFAKKAVTSGKGTINIYFGHGGGTQVGGDEKEKLSEKVFNEIKAVIKKSPFESKLLFFCCYGGNYNELLDEKNRFKTYLKEKRVVSVVEMVKELGRSLREIDGTIEKLKNEVKVPEINIYFGADGSRRDEHVANKKDASWRFLRWKL